MSKKTLNLLAAIALVAVPVYVGSRAILQALGLLPKEGGAPFWVFGIIGLGILLIGLVQVMSAFENRSFAYNWLRYSFTVIGALAFTLLLGWGAISSTDVSVRIKFGVTCVILLVGTVFLALRYFQEMTK